MAAEALQAKTSGCFLDTEKLHFRGGFCQLECNAASGRAEAMQASSLLSTSINVIQGCHDLKIWVSLKIWVNFYFSVLCRTDDSELKFILSDLGASVGARKVAL